MKEILATASMFLAFVILPGMVHSEDQKENQGTIGQRPRDEAFHQ